METEHPTEIQEVVQCAVLTISDSHNKQNDKSGKLILDYLQQKGHEVNCYEVLPNEGEIIKATIKVLAKHEDVEAIIINGGTGIAPRDKAIEVIQPFIAKKLPGFGELFRMISYEEGLGSKSMLTRAMAGIMNQRIVFMIPRSLESARLAMEKLILPELSTAVYELTKDA